MSTPVRNGISLESNTTLQPTLGTKAAAALPAEPLVVIQPKKPWSTADLRELWAHRELLYFLTWRDLKVRYKQTIFGVVWVVLQPLLMTLIFTLFLGMLVRVPSAGLPYPLLVFSGLLPWTFFSSGVLGSAQSLVTNATLITKVYFPRVLIPAANIAGRLIDFLISFSILAVLILYYASIRHASITLSWNILLLPLIVVLMALLTLGLGMLVASLNVKYRDVGVALPVLMQLWMFVSPIVYPIELVPAKFRVLYSLNPIVGLVEGFRAALLGSKIPGFALAITTGVTVILLICAALVFRQTEKTFADVV
jgi:lipopolysaccharide transport system permease protein